MARLFVAALLFALGAICVLAEDEEHQTFGLEYVKMLKCPGGKMPQLAPDGHPMQCIPGGAGPPLCSTDHVCWYNGFNYLCCPMETQSIQDAAWPDKPSSRPIRYDEVPVELVDIPIDEGTVEELEKLTSAEIVLLSKSKSATLKPKTRTFPTVRTVAEDQAFGRTSAAPASETVEQRRAPSISERVNVDETALSPEPIEYVDASLEGEAGDSLPQKWHNVCPPTSSPVIVGKERQLQTCLPRRNECSAGSFCWFSTEEDYICCREPGQPKVELSAAELSSHSVNTFNASSAERNATNRSEESHLHSAEVVPEVFSSTEYDLISEQSAAEQEEQREIVSDEFGREKAAIWFKPQPEANRVAQASHENGTLSEVPARLNGTNSAEEILTPANAAKSSRRRTQGRQPVPKEEINSPSSFDAKNAIPPASVGEAPNESKSQLEQPHARYVPNAAGGYSLVVDPPSTKDNTNEAAKEAAMEFYANQIKNGWPYADEFYVPEYVKAAEGGGDGAVQRDAVPVESQPAQLDPYTEYNYEYARWQDRNSRVRWYKKK